MVQYSKYDIFGEADRHKVRDKAAEISGGCTGKGQISCVRWFEPNARTHQTGY